MADTKKSGNLSAKKARRNKLWRNIGIVVGAAALVAIVLVSYFPSTTYYRQTTAVEIADHDISVAAFNYYYQNVYQNTFSALQETYGDYASLMIDTSKPLSEQQYSETQTWEEYLTETTLSDLTEIYAFYDAAMENGYELDDAAKQEMEDILSSMEAAAENAHYSLDNYLGAIYGKGVNEKLYRELLNTVSVATSYAEDIEAGFTFTDEEIDAYYAENRNEIDSVTARIYPITFETPEEETTDDTADTTDDTADTTDDTADTTDDTVDTTDDTADTTDDTTEADTRTYEEAMELANGIYDAVETEQDFIDYVVSLVPEESQSQYEDGSAFLYNGLSYSAFANTDLSDWLFDDARTAGDITVVEGDSEIYIAMFLSRTDNDYPLVNMRHVLITPEEDEDGNLVEGAEEAAKEQAEELYDEWVENGSTEEYFEILANTYSADGDGTTGGLYEDVYQGQMVSPINEWLFGPRKTGDCEVMESEYGWHIVYFAGLGENYKAKLLDEAMRADAYEAWRTDVTTGYEATTIESGFKLTR